MPTERIQVAVVMALPESFIEVPLEIPRGGTVMNALERAQAHELFRHLTLSDFAVGIFGEVVSRTRLLGDGDRLEVYRPLETDPKTRRRQRAAQND